MYNLVCLCDLDDGSCYCLKYATSLMISANFFCATYSKNAVLVQMKMKLKILILIIVNINTICCQESLPGDTIPGSGSGSGSGTTAPGKFCISFI